MQKYYHNSKFDLYLQQSLIPDAGLGVFTKDYIPKYTYIDEYLGDVYNFNPLSAYVLEVCENYYIDAYNYPRCFMAMINDCTYIAKKIIKKHKKKIDITPHAYYDKNLSKLVVNCEFKKDKKNKMVRVYSVKDILPEQELFISYGDEYWNESKPF